MDPETQTATTTPTVPTKHTTNCLKNAGDEEPIFVLRGTDPLAPKLVRAWANQAELHGVPERKVHGARAIADAMERYQEVDANKQWPA